MTTAFLNLSGYVILLLVSHKEHIDAGIVDYVFNLLLTACRVYGNRHHPVGKGGKIGNKYLRTVGREDSNSSLRFHAQYL